MEIKISDELNAIINYARQEAMRTGSYGIAPDHLFLAIIRHGENTACDVLRGLDADIQEFKSFIDSKIFTNENIPYSEMDSITFSRGTQNVLSITVIEATRAGSPQASSQHLLLALCRNTGGYGTTYLRDTGIDYGRVSSYLERNGMLVSGKENRDEDRTENEEQPQNEDTQQKQSISPLEEFGYDLTKAAAEGRVSEGEKRTILCLSETPGRESPPLSKESHRKLPPGTFLTFLRTKGSSRST